MGGLFGGAPSFHTEDPIIAAMRINTSAYGKAIALCYGKNRVAGNLIWYNDFTAIPHTETSSGGGKGGGGGGSSRTSYTYTAAAIMGLCEGQINGIGTVWAGKEQNTASGLGLSAYSGTASQVPFGYVTTNHPGEALGYRRLAYVATGAYDLGDNASLPNHTFEIDGLLPFSASIRDALPSDILVDYLSDAHHGAGFPAGKIGNLTQWANYCTAAGLFVSPAYTAQEQASEALARLFQCGNAAPFFSEGVLKVVPYGDTTITGNGATYTPVNTAQYTLTDEDFLGETDDPVIVLRGNPADAFNQVQVKYTNRLNQYNDDVVEAKDQANIELHGLRPMQPIDLGDICDINAARAVAQIALQRSLYIRNTYRFTLGWKYCLLEPMDIVTLTEGSGTGLSNVAVRITSIEESEDGAFNVEAEDFIGGIASHVAYPTQQAGGYSENYNANPGSVEPPAFFERRDADALVVSIAVTGQNEMWGGCDVWASLDGSTYKFMKTTRGRARYGVLVADCDDQPSSTLKVQLAGLGGNLLSGTAEEADLFATDCFVGGEFIAYESSAMVTTNRYNLSGLRRGGYGSAAQPHGAGSAFIRIDDSIVDSDALDASVVGKTIYFKFLSFNIWGAGSESLDAATAYPYTVTGVGAVAEIGQIVASESLVVAAGAVVTKVHVTWQVSSTFSHASLSWRLNYGGWTTVPDIYGTSADIILADAGRLELAITPYGAAKGQVVYHAVNVAGKTAPPANVSGLGINFSGRQALLSWNPAVDLDVIVGGWLWVRHTPVMVGAVWGNASDLLPSVPGTATSAPAPVMAGTYLARWVDSSGNLSPSATALVVDGSAVAGLNVVVDQAEAPGWTGTKTNMSVSTGLLVLTDPASLGSYRTAAIDLGSVAPARVSAALTFSGFAVADMIDARTALVDAWADVDGALVEDVSAEVWFSATNDNPAGSPAWTAWAPLRVATDYRARAYRFELRCGAATPDHNISVSALDLFIDVEDRSESGSNVVSGAGVYSVTFSRPFFAVPAVGITAHGMATGDYYTLSAKSENGFTVTFKNAAGTAISRTFDWIAKGY